MYRAAGAFLSFLFVLRAQNLSEPVHHVGFMLHKGMCVAVERYGRVFVPEDLGERFYVHAAFEGAGGESMSQGVKALVGDFKFFSGAIQNCVGSGQIRAFRSPTPRRANRSFSLCF